MQRSSLISARKERGLSRKSLADAVGVTPQYIGMIETGTRAPKLELALKIAQLFEVQVESLFLPCNPKKGEK